MSLYILQSGQVLTTRLSFLSVFFSVHQPCSNIAVVNCADGGTSNEVEYVKLLNLPAA